MLGSGRQLANAGTAFRTVGTARRISASTRRPTTRLRSGIAAM